MTDRDPTATEDPARDGARSDGGRIGAEARLNALLAATSDVVYRMSADWSELQPLDGRGLVASSDAPIRDWMQRVPADEHARVKAAIAAAIATKGVFELEHRVFGPDGGETWTHSRAVPILDERGDIVEWFGLARDVTESKRAQDALRESEQRFRALFEQSTGGIAQVDLEGRFVLVNDRYCEIVGRSREELLTLRMQDLTHSQDVGGNVSLFAQLAQGLIADFTIEKRYVRPDGSAVWVQSAVSGARGADGRVRYITAMVADITDLRVARERQAALAAQRQLALDAARLGWWQYDLATGLVTHDARYAEIYGLEGPGPRRAEEIGALLHPEDAPRLWAAVEAAVHPVEPQPYAVQFRINRPDGTLRWLEARGIASFDGQGESRVVSSFVGTVADVTERHLAEEALAEASRRKDQFLATLAHELRNPLAPISNALQVWPLLKQKPEEASRLRDMMGRQVQQMVRLIDDLLDVSRITRGKIELRRDRVDLSAAVEGAVEALKPFVDAHRHELTIALPAEPVFVDADLGRLVQVFGNLLHNAAKYTSPGGRIQLSAKREGEAVVVVVRDNGCGIPGEMLGGVFEMFAQVDQSLGRTHGGLGIGLTLVKNLVELHGGTIEAISEGPGRGSEFVVRLPVATEESTVSAPASTPAKSLPTPPSHRVLVVDDVEPSANTLALMLKWLGQEPRACYDGASALSAVEEFRPRVAFLDIAMPGMDGYELAQRIRAIPGYAPVLVALTGYGQQEDRQRAFAAGFDHHLVKPTTVEALHELLMTVLAR
ncbi:PAS domain S-box protein [Lysobacter korlensis]|uniref:histidine kinase n=1 Tax=Lysobacter korlensis TaxID=553636 RepID=A0ABV6RI86_9GAMM